MKKHYIGFALFSFILVVQSVAGSIGFTQINYFMTWEPDCTEPSAPFISFTNDVDSYNRAVDRFNDYVTDVDSYLSCVQSEADQDIRMLSNAVVRSAEKKQTDVISDLNRARSSLQRQKSYL